MKFWSWSGSDGSATCDAPPPHVGEQTVEDDLVGEVVGVVEVLL